MTRCANCDHTNPHTGSSAGGGPDDPNDACTHPMCNCGYFLPTVDPKIARLTKIQQGNDLAVQCELEPADNDTAFLLATISALTKDKDFMLKSWKHEVEEAEAEIARLTRVAKGCGIQADRMGEKYREAKEQLDNALETQRAMVESNQANYDRYIEADTALSHANGQLDFFKTYLCLDCVWYETDTEKGVKPCKRHGGM